MYGKQLLTYLKDNTTIPFSHYAWTSAPQQTSEIKAYGIFTENKIDKMVFSNKQKEQVLDCDIDVFCYDDEMDENKAQVENVLDSLEIAYSFDDIEFDQETKLVHLTWTTRCIYGSGVSPLSTLYLHDLQQHLCSGYSAVQIEDSNIIASNIRKDVNILGVIGTYGGGGGEPYPGPYSITSSAQDDQELQTATYEMQQNVKIGKNITTTSPTPSTTGTTFTIY